MGEGRNSLRESSQGGFSSEVSLRGFILCSKQSCWRETRPCPGQVAEVVLQVILPSASSSSLCSPGHPDHITAWLIVPLMGGIDFGFKSSSGILQT